MERLVDTFDYLADLYMKYREIPSFQFISGMVLATCVIGALLLIRSAYKSETEIVHLLEEIENDGFNE